MRVSENTKAPTNWLYELSPRFGVDRIEHG